MTFTRNHLLLVLLFCVLISCADAIGEQRNSAPEKKTTPTNFHRNMKEDLPNEETPEAIVPPSENKIKKQKTRSKDTLKPISVIP